MSEIAKQLVRIAHNEERCLEDAAGHRRKLLALSSFDSIDVLAGLAATQSVVELEQALQELLACARRARELGRERRELAGT